jgi:hypothetical protein
MRPACLLPLAVAWTLGCGMSPPADTGLVPTTVAQSFSTQVAAVRAGEATRITADQPLSDAEWESLRGLAGLRELVLHAGVADDDRARLLATLPNLERLVLRESPLSDAGFQELARCGRLRDLNVPQAACTPAGIRALATLPRLRSLRLGGPHLVGADIGRAVAELVQLRSLHLIDVPLGDEGLDAIARLPGLWNLYLDGAEVSDEAWTRYFQTHPDVHVHVDQAHHDRDPARDHD